MGTTNSSSGMRQQSLVCLIKGCGISFDKLGYVSCPDCGQPYCWDSRYIKSFIVGPGRIPTDYPFMFWLPCDHGNRCINRRLHKNRNDILYRTLKDSLNKRYERIKLNPPIYP